MRATRAGRHCYPRQMASTRNDLIRPMTAADVEPAADLLRRGDWGERLVFFDWAVRQPTLYPFVAEYGGEIVGTGVASAHGPVGWVGTIFVAPDRRGSGLGGALTRAVVDELDGRGCRTLVLIATPLGRPIYEREGFTVLDEQVRFSIDGLQPDPAGLGPGIRAYGPADFEAVVALDRFATGEDRQAVLASLLDPASTWVATGVDADVVGYLARAPWRGGALIAPNPDAALRLLEARRHATGISGKAAAGVLGSNAVGREILRRAGWLEEGSGVRMIRGEPLDWHPEAIWGQFNGALG